MDTALSTTQERTRRRKTDHDDDELVGRRRAGRFERRGLLSFRESMRHGIGNGIETVQGIRTRRDGQGGHHEAEK